MTRSAARRYRDAATATFVASTTVELDIAALVCAFAPTQTQHAARADNAVAPAGQRYSAA